MTPPATWVRGVRPRTLGAAIAPVLVGTASVGDDASWTRLGLALVVALALQVAVNLANDLQDGVRGVDTPDRAGPVRLVASGAASPSAVRAAALTAIAIAAAAGLGLAAMTSWWIVGLGAVAIAALWLYSGGPRPYASLGLGEVMVFAFFGVMATAGSAWVQVGTVPASAWWGSVSIGLLAVAILVANNLRDIPTDTAAGKRTLAVRIGDRATRRLYRACVTGAYVTVCVGVLVGLRWPHIGLSQWNLVSLPSWILAIRPMEQVGTARGRELVPVLVGTGAVQIAFGALLALGLWAAP